MTEYKDGRGDYYRDGEWREDWRIRQEVTIRDEGTCQWCKVPGGALDAHHVLRRSQGGKDEVANLKSVHRICHRYIHEHPTEAKARGFLA